MSLVIPTLVTTMRKIRQSRAACEDEFKTRTDKAVKNACSIVMKFCDLLLAELTSRFNPERVTEDIRPFLTASYLDPRFVWILWRTQLPVV